MDSFGESSSQPIHPKKRNLENIAPTSSKIIKRGTETRTSSSDRELGSDSNDKVCVGKKQQNENGDYEKNIESSLQENDEWNYYFNALISCGNDKNLWNIEETYRYELSDGNFINLGEWLATQRALYKLSELPSDRQRKLQDMVDKNFLTWDKSQTLDDYWIMMYNFLVQYGNKHKGNCNVPYGHFYSLPDNTTINLGKWLFHQRKQYLDVKLPVDKYKRFQHLVELDHLVWEEHQLELFKQICDERWKINYHYLLQYAKEHNGYCAIPRNYILTLPDKTEIKLGQWLVYFCKLHRRQTLGKEWEEKFRKLIKANRFCWECYY